MKTAPTTPEETDDQFLLRMIRERLVDTTLRLRGSRYAEVMIVIRFDDGQDYRKDVSRLAIIMRDRRLKSTPAEEECNGNNHNRPGP